MKTSSRMKDFWNKTFFDEKNNPKQGHEYRTLRDSFGYNEVGILLRWKDGRLNDDGDQPAVEFQDAHIEHFQNGLLHNDLKESDGYLSPAIISDYGKKMEYWLKGKQVQPPKELAS